MSLLVPQRLLRLETQRARRHGGDTVPITGTRNHDTGPERHMAGMTVYSVRVTTAKRRGSSLSDTNSGLMLCLIDKSKDAIMTFIPCIEGTTESDSEVREMCRTDTVVPAGVDCSLTLNLTSNRSDGMHAYSHHRFQRGEVSEISFVAPCLGPLEAALIGPLSGTWACDELVVSSSTETDKMATTKFIRQSKNELPDSSCISTYYLRALPSGSTMYGEGAYAQILSPHVASGIASQNMAEYNRMKSKLLVYIAAVGFVGTVISEYGLGHEQAISFFMGSLVSFLSQTSLQKRVDSIGETAVESSPTMFPRLSHLPIAALLIMSVAGALIVTDMLGENPTPDFHLSDTSRIQSLDVAVALVAGLFTQKISVILYLLFDGGSKVQGSPSYDHSTSTSIQTSDSHPEDSS